MKRVFVLLIGISSTVTSFSQLALGIQGTGNLSDASIKNTTLAELDKKARVLPSAGIVADLTLSSSVTVRSGINFLQQGITLKSAVPGPAGEIDMIRFSSKLNLNYLQVPLNVLYTTKGAVQFFAGGGPYFSYAISGKSKDDITYEFADGSKETEKQETDVFEKDENGDRTWKRTDFGIGAVAGVKLAGGFFANVGYQFSLSNLNKADDGKYRNRGLQLTVGYYLWRK